MTTLLFVVVSLAGGLGSAMRLLLDGVIQERSRGTAPWGTITINLTGSLLLGIVVGSAAGSLLQEQAKQVAGLGFLGGYTTFSTASFETVRLLRQRRWTTGILNGLGVLVAATAAAGLGLWVGSLLR